MVDSADIYFIQHFSAGHIVSRVHFGVKVVYIPFLEEKYMLFKKKDVSNFFLPNWHYIDVTKVTYLFSWYKRDIKCMKIECDALQLK